MDPLGGPAAVPLSGYLRRVAGNGIPNGWGGGERNQAAPPARTHEPYGSYGSQGSQGPQGPYGAQGSYGDDPYRGDPDRDDPYRADRPGNTRAFPVGGQGYGADQGYGPDRGYGADRGYGGGQGHAGAQGYAGGEDYAGGQGYGAHGGAEQGWERPGARSQAGDRPDHVATYRAGGRTAPRTGGPRLRWRELLIGIYRAPARTFDQMRDHQMWLTAVTVSLIYAVVAVLGFGDTHDEVVNSTFATAAWSLAGAAVAFAVAGLMLGSVTYALSRQLGGDGPWASTVGLAVLIGWTSDVPRLLLALFLPSDNLLVQAAGWLTWLFCAVLMTTMIRRVHDLPWGKAAGAASIQLLALLVLIKLPTLG